MRNTGGYDVIKKAIEKLGLRHKEHISAYGEGNERRLTGRHETADINTFCWVSYKFFLLQIYMLSSSFIPLLLVVPFSANKSFYLTIFYANLCIIQGVANRGASIRVGRDTEKEGKG